MSTGELLSHADGLPVTYPPVQHWGGIRFEGLYGRRCVGCTADATHTLAVVPERLAGEAFAAPANQVRACDRCAVAWRNARPAARQLAAVILRNGFVHPDLPFGMWGEHGDDIIYPARMHEIVERDCNGRTDFQHRNYVKRAHVADRDLGQCRVCRRQGSPLQEDITVSQVAPYQRPKTLVVGHILPQWTARRGTGTPEEHPLRGWGVPRSLVYDQANVVSMCVDCNGSIGTALPPIPVAFHYLLKAWTRDVAACTP